MVVNLVTNMVVNLVTNMVEHFHTNLSLFMPVSAPQVIPRCCDVRIIFQMEYIFIACVLGVCDTHNRYLYLRSRTVTDREAYHIRQQCMYGSERVLFTIKWGL